MLRNRQNMMKPVKGIDLFGKEICGLFVVMSLLWVVPLEGQAQTRSKEIMKKGTIEVGVLGGYSKAFTELNGAKSSNRKAVYVLPQIGYVFTDFIDADPFSGVFEVLFEPVAAHYHEPFSASLFGASLVLRYNFLTFGRWMPYWDFGAGVSWTDLAPRIPEQSTKFNFLLQGGPGLQYFLTERSALNVAVRMQHISNANIGNRNTGINSILGLIGYSYYFVD